MIQWKNIHTVLLDMDGTILDLNFDNYFWLHYLPEIYAKNNNLSLEDAKKLLSNLFNAKHGSLEWYCLDYWSDTLKLNIIKLKNDIRHKVTFRPNAIAFLEFLKKLHKDVYLVTNAHPKSLEIKLLQTQFDHYFSELISCHRFGKPKEDLNLWKNLQKELNFDIRKTLFIDDSQAILKTAKTFGIAYVLGIAQPDSQLPSKDLTPFFALNDFTEIMTP